ncbi:hypothetical protein EXVG_00337 [Emiliania huxleyi virus 202]|nr:hypothetical protein EXVG_00337 [Emiliania huxleyi virus 202]AHA54211.1 hypothetical protein EhV18_00164 [Emiliania huxleyi virus 18]
MHMMFFITTKSMSRYFPTSRIIGEYEIGGRVIQESGQIVREFTPSPSPGKYKQYWITKDTGDIYLRHLNKDHSYTWEYVSDHEFNITKAVAQAWVEPPVVDEQLYPRAWKDSDCNAEFIAWFPSFGSSVDFKITLSDAQTQGAMKFVKDSDVSENDTEDEETTILYPLLQLPSYTGNKILTKSTYYFSAHENAMYVTNVNNKYVKYAGIRTGNPNRHVKFTLPECTLLLHDIRRQIFAIPSAEDHRKDSIYNYVRKHGLKLDGLRQEIRSKAADNTMISYISAAVQPKDVIDRKIWKKITTHAMRTAISEIYDPSEPMRHKELYDYIYENYDSAIIGRSDAEIYMQIRLITGILNILYNKSESYPTGWL